TIQDFSLLKAKLQPTVVAASPSPTSATLPAGTCRDDSNCGSGFKCQQTACANPGQGIKANPNACLGACVAVPVKTSTIKLAEDANFTVNVQKNQLPDNVTTQTYTYTFSNTTPGTKNLYVQFLTSDGKTTNAK